MNNNNNTKLAQECLIALESKNDQLIVKDFSDMQVQCVVENILTCLTVLVCLIILSKMSVLIITPQKGRNFKLRLFSHSKLSPDVTNN